jgi:hypothetical protein
MKLFQVNVIDPSKSDPYIQIPHTLYVCCDELPDAYDVALDRLKSYPPAQVLSILQISPQAGVECFICEYEEVSKEEG